MGTLLYLPNHKTILLALFVLLWLSGSSQVVYENNPIGAQWGHPAFDFVSGFYDLFIDDCKKLIDAGARFWKYTGTGYELPDHDSGR